MAISYQHSTGILERVLLQALVSRNVQLTPSFPATSQALVSAGASAWCGYSDNAYQKMLVGFWVFAREAISPSYVYDPGEATGVQGDSHRISACADDIIAEIKSTNPAYDSSLEAMLANFGGLTHKAIKGFVLYCLSEYAKTIVGSTVSREAAIQKGASRSTKDYDSFLVSLVGSGSARGDVFRADSTLITADNTNITLDQITI